MSTASVLLYARMRHGLGDIRHALTKRAVFPAPGTALTDTFFPCLMSLQAASCSAVGESIFFEAHFTKGERERDVCLFGRDPNQTDMGDNFDAKFGACPVSVPSSSSSAHTLIRHESSSASRNFFVLVGQTILCVVILLSMQPPFVVKKINDTVHTDIGKVVFISALTSSSSLFFHMSGMAPSNTFTKSFEFLYRMSKT